MKSLQDELRDAAGTLTRLEDGWSCVYTLPQRFSGFAGHFPGYPVLPAVVQVRMALMVIAKACGAEPVVRELKQAKFMAPLLPDEAIAVQVRSESPHEAPFSARWDCTLYRDATKAAQCQLLLEFPGAS